MLASALAPVGGLCVWRAFVHPGEGIPGWSNASDQCVMQAALFQEYDGLWADNVVLQVGRLVGRLVGW